LDLDDVQVNRMRSLGKKWGCDPRSLLLRIQTRLTDIEIEEEYRAQAPVAVKRCADILLANALLADAPSQFFFCRPKSKDHRTIPRAFVPTKTICQILGEALREYDNNVRLSFFRALSQHSETRTAAGYIYKHMFHCYFAAGKPIQCELIQPGRRSNVIRLTDSESSNLIPSTWRALTTRTPPFFFVAPKGAHGIDSALVLEKEIYVFQLTISSTHGSPIDGMKKVRDYLPSRLRNITWNVVFVGQESSAASSVANEWKGKLFFPTEKKHISIGWAEVDPVMKGVRYMVCKVVIHR
jgi:hypothetical protein